MNLRGVLAAVIAVVPSVALAQRAIDIPVGSMAPDMKLETLDGKPASFAPWLGKKPMLIEVWATWCENCEALAPRILEAKKKYGNEVQFVGVAVSFNQSPARVKAHMEKHGFDILTFYDKLGEADVVYGVKATSTVIALDRAGRVVYAGAGAGQDIDLAVRKSLGKG